MLRNPAVALEDWPEPGESEAADAEGDHEDGESADSEEDSEDMEREEPLEFNADDEPEIDHEQLRAFIEANLGHMDEDEWLDLCKFYLFFAPSYIYCYS